MVIDFWNKLKKYLFIFSTKLRNTLLYSQSIIFPRRFHINIFNSTPLMDKIKRQIAYKIKLSFGDYQGTQRENNTQTKRRQNRDKEKTIKR